MNSKKSVSNLRQRHGSNTRSVDNRMYCQVSFGNDKLVPCMSQQQNITNSILEQNTLSKFPKHRCSYSSIDNRNLIVNVQIMGKKQDTI